MNAYGSAIRTYIAANVIEESFTPPNQLDLTNSNIRPQLFQMGGSTYNNVLASSGHDDWNIESNFVLRRIGLFSNFADGFVYLAPCVRPSIRLRAFPWTVNAALPGTVTFTPATRSLVGTLTTWNTPGPGKLTVGAYYSLNGHLIQISAVAGDTTATATQYAGLVSQVAIVGGMLSSITIFPTDFVENVIPCINTFNYMYEQERFFPAALMHVGFTPTNIALLATLEFTDTVSLGTKSIDTAWAGSVATFDVVADIEITMGVP